MKIVFVDNLLIEHRAEHFDFDVQPHLGLISLIALARSAGHDATVFDPKLEIANGHLTFDSQLYFAMAERICSMKPDIVGFTSLGCNFIVVARTAAYIRSLNPEISILLGGPHATILDTEILAEFEQFDIIVRHEAEPILLGVIDGVPASSWSHIPSVTYRKDGRIVQNQGKSIVENLDSLPWPAFDAYPRGVYDRKSIRIEAGRGCPFNCTFCSTASFFGRSYRLKSPERITAEMDYLHKEYGVSRFGLTHDLFTVNRRKVIAFCEYVAGRGYEWSCSARMDCVDDELLELMASAGCCAIYYGVETGSPRLQKLVKKRLAIDLVAPTLERTIKLGMSATVSLITGYPQEEASDQIETLDLIGICLENHPNSERLNVQLHLLTPEPGTQLLEEFGEKLAYDGHVTDFNFPTLSKDDNTIMSSNPRIFVNHHFYPSVLPRDRHIFVTDMCSQLLELGGQ